MKPVPTPPSSDLAACTRWVVYGNSGCGKSTLAGQIGDLLGLPLTHLDHLRFGENWSRVGAEEFVAAVRRFASGDRWVCDGAFEDAVPVLFGRAQVIVFLDLPRIVCAWRVIRRGARHRHRQRPDAPPGSRDRLTWKMTLGKLAHPRAPLLGALESAAGVPVIRLASTTQVRDVLAALEVGRRASASQHGTLPPHPAHHRDRVAPSPRPPAYYRPLDSS